MLLTNLQYPGFKKLVEEMTVQKKHKLNVKELKITSALQYVQMDEWFLIKYSKRIRNI